MEVATLQLPSHKRYQENLDTLLFHLKAHQDKDIIVAPEVFLTSFDYEHMATAAKFSANANERGSSSILIRKRITSPGRHPK